MIVVTGAAGFIGSCMIQKLNSQGIDDVVAVDDFSRTDKSPNLAGKKIRQQVHRDSFIRWFERHSAEVEAVLHLGARTDTTEQNVAIFDTLNLEYSKAIWMLCSGFHIPLLYASSAATYGLGEQGYADDHALIPQLKPLNPYGQSKQDFDRWILTNDKLRMTNDKLLMTNDELQMTNDESRITNHESPPHWAGFKFFNVYGPNEYHKGRMASVIFHAARQIKATGKMKLFRSHRPDYADGMQSRDFIYVKDVVDVLYYFLQNRPTNGIYNLGTGQARPFLDLVTCTFRALGVEPDISFIDTPADIRDTYQYFTEATMHKMRAAGYLAPFHSLEDGITDYAGRYLKEELIL
jgi:ADP-L-glycero-D-manno-heptose 6-epimerase